MSNLNTDINFWEEYPELKAAGPFKKLYTSDKSRGKGSSSKLAWAIALIWDRGSKYYNFPEEGKDGKIFLIFDDFFGDFKYYTANKEKIEELKDWYLRAGETIAMRTLRGILDKLEERDKFLRKTPYDAPSPEFDETYGVSEWAKRIDTIDKMLANTDKIYTLYDKARTVVEKEEQSHSKGDAQLSLSDSDEI